MKRRSQVAIIALLISAVVMALGLSLSRQAVVNTKIDVNEERLKQAFSVAESGINYYLGTGQKSYSDTETGSKADISTRGLGGESTLDFGEVIPAGESESFWLVNHNANGSLGSSYYVGTVQLCARNFNSSVAVSVFSRSGSGYVVARSGFNFAGSSAVNGFTPVPVGTDCVAVTLPASPVLLAATPLFNSGSFYLQGTGTFPPQGEEITAVGKQGESEGQISQRLVVSERYKVPSFMMWGMTAYGSIR